MGCDASGPSQIRYVFYYHFILNHQFVLKPSLHLTTVEIPVGTESGANPQITAIQWNESYASLKFEISIQSVLSLSSSHL